MPCFILFCFINLCRYVYVYTYVIYIFFFFILFFLQNEGLLWQPCIKQAFQHNFSNSICSPVVSVLHLGNSHNISNFFIIIIFVMVIFDECFNLTTIIVLRCHELCPYKTLNLMDKCCVF